MRLNRLHTAEDLTEAFHLWNEPIFRTMYARTGQRTVAEDLAQETFMKAWSKCQTFNPEKASLKTWLFSIAMNTMRDFFRSEKNRKIIELPEDLSDESDMRGDYRKSEEVTFVFRELRSFPQRDQELLTLRYVQGLSHLEISRILKMSETATKVAMHRALKKLRTRCNNRMKFAEEKLIATLSSSV